MKEIISKFRFRGHALVLDAPAALEAAFVQLGCTTAFNAATPSANTVVFIRDQRAFLDFLTHRLRQIVPDSVLWFAYPKGTSKMATDINRDTLRATGETFGLATVTAISIDDTWSALRFRPVEKVGKK
jgi:hypothetical protein